MMSGFIFLPSLIFLSLVVCSVYTMAVEVHADYNKLFRSMAFRFVRLAGVLAALAIVVFFFSLV